MLRSSGGEKLAHKVDLVEDILQDLLDLDHIVNLPSSLGMEKVLCHGDMWSTNLIWRKGKEHVDLAAVIDFQDAIGPQDGSLFSRFAQRWADDIEYSDYQFMQNPVL
ncbi:hypothetical protein COOONC_23290 [Cooperia oncophora]